MAYKKQCVKDRRSLNGSGMKGKAFQVEEQQEKSEMGIWYLGRPP